MCVEDLLEEICCVSVHRRRPPLSYSGHPSLARRISSTCHVHVYLFSLFAKNISLSVHLLFSSVFGRMNQRSEVIVAVHDQIKCISGQRQSLSQRVFPNKKDIRQAAQTLYCSSLFFRESCSSGVKIHFYSVKTRSYRQVLSFYIVFVGRRNKLK